MVAMITMMIKKQCHLFNYKTGIIIDAFSHPSSEYSCTKQEHCFTYETTGRVSKFPKVRCLTALKPDFGFRPATPMTIG